MRESEERVIVVGDNNVKRVVKNITEEFGVREMNDSGEETDGVMYRGQ